MLSLRRGMGRGSFKPHLLREVEVQTETPLVEWVWIVSEKVLKVISF